MKKLSDCPLCMYPLTNTPMSGTVNYMQSNVISSYCLRCRGYEQVTDKVSKKVNAITFITSSHSVRIDYTGSILGGLHIYSIIPNERKVFTLLVKIDTTFDPDFSDLNELEEKIKKYILFS